LNKKLDRNGLTNKKIKFVQEFLKLHSEQAISRLEILLKEEKKPTWTTILIQ